MSGYNDTPSIPEQRCLLRPLEPPPRSALGLDWMDQDPPEFAMQRYQEARRRATKLMNAAYRVALENLGFEKPGPPPREDLEPVPERVGDFRKVYSALPVPLPLPAEAVRSASLPALTRALTSGPRQLQSTARSASSGTSSRQKAATAKLWEFGRGAQGTPYTYSQVFEEVEAKLRYRPARDTRAQAGRLGSAVLGAGTMRAPRQLPQLQHGKFGQHSSGIPVGAGTAPSPGSPWSHSGGAPHAHAWTR